MSCHVRIEFICSPNRILAEDVKSDMDIPPFDKSAMDGYACKKADLSNELTVIETIPAGNKPLKKIHKGQCSYVATGAAIPEMADGVVMVEFSERDGNKVLISKAITPGTHIIEIGHDIKKGEIIINKDRQICYKCS